MDDGENCPSSLLEDGSRYGLGEIPSDKQYEGAVWSFVLLIEKHTRAGESGEKSVSSDDSPIHKKTGSCEGLSVRSRVYGGERIYMSCLDCQHLRVSMPFRMRQKICRHEKSFSIALISAEHHRIVERAAARDVSIRRES